MSSLIRSSVSQLVSQLLSQLNLQLSSQLLSQLDSQLNLQLSSQLLSQLHASCRHCRSICSVDSQLGFQLLSQLSSQLLSPLNLQLDSQLLSQLSSQLPSPLNLQLDSQLRFAARICSSVRGSVSSATPLCGGEPGAAGTMEPKILGVKFDEDIFAIFKDWVTHVPVIFANETIPIVSRHPSEVHWQNGLLHNETGQSVRFRSGWGLWTIEGTPVDEQIVMYPETQTVEQIDKEENQDVRAIRIQRFGWPRYIRESGAEAKDERKNEVEGTREALFVCRDGSRRLIVTCPTGRVFALECSAGDYKLQRRPRMACRR